MMNAQKTDHMARSVAELHLPTIRWDFLIVGAGIAGLSLAEALTRQSPATILVLEASRVGSGASTRNAGRLAHAGIGTPELAEVARESRRSWHEMQRRIGWSLHIQQLGELTVFYREREVRRFKRVVQPALQSAGLTSKLINPGEISIYAPGYNASEAIAAFYCKDSFALHHDAALHGLMEALLDAGVTICENSTVTGFLRSGSEIFGVIASEQEIEADNIILCCGDAAIELVAELGWKAPVRIERQQMIVTETLQELKWPIVRWTGPNSSGSCHQIVRGEVVAACQDPRVDTKRNDRCTLRFLTRTSRQIFRNLPLLRGAAILRQWGGLTTKTADHFPFAGLIPGTTSVWGLYGMNAFTIYPLIAQWLAATLLGKQAHPTMERCAFSPERGVKAASTP